jgi:tetrathionate reductase subunit B
LKYALMIDINRCSICYACQAACKDEFVGNLHLPYSYTQTDREPAWIKITETEKGKYPFVKVYPTPVMCMQCDKAPCIDACPVKNCIYKSEQGIVIIDPEKCNGCKSCIEACPYEAIYFNDDKSICQKCTLCIHKLEEGKEPACIDACPSNVFLLGEESKVRKEAENRGARPMYPEFKTKPRVYYLGLPSVSLAGHVIGTKSLMDVPDADVTITDLGTGATLSLRTNIAGNFLATYLVINNTYNIKIKHAGHAPKTIDNVKVDVEYKHLGEIKLETKSQKG